MPVTHIMNQCCLIDRGTNVNLADIGVLVETQTHVKVYSKYITYFNAFIQFNNLP